MDKEAGLSPQIIKYEEGLKSNPRSLVFVPLADCYRKLNLFDKAFAVLKKGIRYNPEYTIAYLVLARCYFETEELTLAYSTLRPLIAQNRENIKMQELFGDICLALNHDEEALDTFKYLLFLNPKNRKISKLVNKIEKKVNDVIIQEGKEDLIVFDIDNLKTESEVQDEKLDEWIQEDLSLNKEKTIASSEEDIDQWSSETVKNDEIDENAKVSLKEALPKTENKPLMTLTLADLYIKQGHLEKAKEVLEKISEYQPHDEETAKKLLYVNERIGQIDQEEDPDSSNEVNSLEKEGRDNLMGLIDKKIGPPPNEEREDEEGLSPFLSSSGTKEENPEEKIQATLWKWHMALVDSADKHKNQ